jgi:hypothetical protein
VLVAAIIRLAVGFAWYSPLLFLKPWQALTGITQEAMQAGTGKAAAIDAVASLVMGYVLVHIIRAANIHDWLSGALLGFYVWLAFQAMLLVTPWGYENRPLKLIAINLGNNFIALVLMGALLTAWPWTASRCGLARFAPRVRQVTVTLPRLAQA